MCQLIFANTNQIQVNKLYLTVQQIIDSSLRHKDGTGIFFEGSEKKKKFHIVKSEIPASENPNYAKEFTKLITTNTPVIAHVRLATYSQLIDNDHAHPFMNKDIALAHNGTLAFKDITKNTPGYLKKKYPNMIDTERFLQHLIKNYTKKKSFYKALVDTMDIFTGKFAFLIFDGREETFYVVRGHNADLHLADIFLNGTRIGFVINTEKRDLEKALFMTEQLWNLAHKTVLTSSEILLLEPETVYEVKDRSLKVVGKIIQNFPSFKSTSPKVYSLTTKTTFGSTTKGLIESDTTKTTKTGGTVGYSYEKLYDFCQEYSINYIELDLLLNELLGTSILTLALPDLRDLETIIIPTLESFFGGKGGKVKLKSRGKIITKTTKRLERLAPNSSILKYKLEEKLNFPAVITDTQTLSAFEVSTRHATSMAERIKKVT